MILECPACQKRYLVDPRSVGIAGRTVRCANCKNEWHAELSEEAREALAAKQDNSFESEVEAAVAASVSEEDVAQSEAAAAEAAERRRARKTNVPALTKNKPAVSAALKLATLALGLIFFIVAGVYFRPMILQAFPAAEAAYRVLGLYNSDGVVLAEMAYERSEIGTKDSHQFSGTLVNTTQEIRRLPSLKIRLLGDEGQVIKNRILTEKIDLQPGEQKAFRTSIESSPGSTALVVVEHGNGMELKLRAKPKQDVTEEPKTTPEPQKEEAHDEHH